jgi:tetratricopeptide (TPR) repeat protein
MDEDGTHRQLENSLDFFTSAIGDHGGKVHHFAGDAVLATFENNSAAVQCAAIVQSRIDVSAATYASVLNYLDHSEEAIQYAKQAIRLTPVAPTIYPGILASCYYGAGRYEDAVAAAHTVIEHNIDALDAWLVIAAAENAMGNRSAANAAAKEVLEVKPDFTLGGYLETQPYADSQQLETLGSHLASAGLQ